MGLDGGYIGSLDHAISNLHVGRQQGRRQGFSEGYERGFEEGQHDGWGKAIELANERIREEQALVRQHLAEKERLRLELQELQQACQNFQKQVADLDAKYRGEFKQRKKLVRQYNSCLVFMGAVRRVVEDLISKETPQAERARELFAEKYGELVDDALKSGELKTPPEKDADFAKELPVTHKFIVTTIHSVGQKSELSGSAPEL